jgi:hypothetical protein
MAHKETLITEVKKILKTLITPSNPFIPNRPKQVRFSHKLLLGSNF